MTRLSIVATLYQSESSVEPFVERSAAAAGRVVGDDHEIVLVNDGSPDGSLAVAARLARANPRLKVVDLSRNFGHHKAMMTGLAHSAGDLVFLLDSDLEEAPEWLDRFKATLDETGCDVAFGVQRQRKGGTFERWSGALFYRLFRTLTGLTLSANIVTARLMRRPYVDALLRHDEREVFMAGLWHITGFDQRAVPVDKLSLSPTSYSFRRKLHLLIDSVASFSNLPLIGIFYLGVVMSVLASAYIAYLVLGYFARGTVADGWTSVMASIWLVGGMIIASLGVIGIYLSKVYSEAKRRPYTVVRRVITSEGDAP